MNKQKLIEWETEQFHERIKKITELPDVPDELAYDVSCLWDVAKYDKIITFDQLVPELHKMREVLGEYKIDTYWIPNSGMVCVDYLFGKTRVWYRINTDHEQEVITILSVGKCKVVDSVSKSVVCKL